MAVVEQCVIQCKTSDENGHSSTLYIHDRYSTRQLRLLKSYYQEISFFTDLCSLFSLAGLCQKKDTMMIDASNIKTVVL